MTKALRTLQLLIGALALLVSAAAVMIDRAAEERMRADARLALAAIAELKTRHTASWLSERAADAYALGHDPFFAEAARQWIDGAAPIDGGGRLLTALSERVTAYGYEGIALVDRSGAVRLSIGAAPELDDEDRRAVEAVMQRPELRVRTTRADGRYHSLDAIGPLFAARGTSYGPVAAVLFRVDIGTGLDPLVQEWLGSSASGEAYIVGQTQGQAIYVTGLRHGADALSKAASGNGDPLAALATAGFVGEIESTDYRGLPVIAAIRAVPGMPWALIVKMDAEEALSGLWALRARIAGLASAFFGILAGSLLFLWRGLRRRVNLQQAKTAEALIESEQRYRELFDSGNDGILIFRFEGRIVEVNKVACQQLGRSREQMLALNMSDIVAPRFAAKISERIEEMRAKGGGMFDSAEVRADGSIVPVELSVRLIDYEGAPALLAVVRDATERERLMEAERESARRSEAALMGAVGAMATLIEQRDPYTAGHQRKVAALATALARQMGYAEDRIKGIALAASILDIGKISVPAEILGRPGALSEAELDIVKGHAEAGFAILKDVGFPWPIAEFVRQHHERLDGSGYPRGLKGEAILPEARILAVADCVAAMASHRPYRNAFPIDAVLSEMSRQKGTRYDAGVVEACLRLFQEKGYALA